MFSGSPDLQRSDREVDSLLYSLKKRSRGVDMRGRGPYSQSPSVSERMKPLSKYDHRPRNVELDGNNIVVTTRRKSGQSYRERRRKDFSYREEDGEGEVVEEGTSSVSISELEFGSDDDDISQAGRGRRAEGRGQQARTGGGVGGWAEGGRTAVKEYMGWFVGTSKLRLALLAAVMGLVFGIGYRGGLGSGLYLGLFPRGMYVQ